MAGAAINPHSFKKYKNGKSGLLSGMVTLQTPASFLDVTENTTIQEFVDWKDYNRHAHQSIILTMIEGKLIEMCQKLSFHVESDRWESPKFGGIQSITVTKETPIVAMVKWIMQMPCYEPYESALIEGIRNFIALKNG